MSRTVRKNKIEDLGCKWAYKEPKWWRNLYKHRPRRRESKVALHNYLQGKEDVVFPLDKKPWKYYW